MIGWLFFIIIIIVIVIIVALIAQPPIPPPVVNPDAPINPPPTNPTNPTNPVPCLNTSMQMNRYTLIKSNRIVPNKTYYMGYTDDAVNGTYNVILTEGYPRLDGRTNISYMWFLNGRNIMINNRPGLGLLTKIDATIPYPL